jgi:hypothetical protein
MRPNDSDFSAPDASGFALIVIAGLLVCGTAVLSVIGWLFRHLVWKP